MNASASQGDRKARILVVDDHPLLREGVTQLINRQSDLVVCGEADAVSSASTAVETLQPDLVLLDLRLGCGDALELIKSLKARFPRLWILVLSQHDEALYAERALRAGASGYVMKQEAAEEVLTAIRMVLAGELYVSRKTAVLVLRKLLKRESSERHDGLESLTDRELQVFQLLGAGLKSRQIADELRLSIKTVETYRENIKHKLGLQNAAELIRNAVSWVQGRPAQVAETQNPANSQG